MKYLCVLQLLLINLSEFDAAIYPQDPKSAQGETVALKHTTETHYLHAAAPPFGFITANPKHDVTSQNSQHFGRLTKSTVSPQAAAAQFGLQAGNVKNRILTKRYRRNSDVEEIESEDESPNPVYRLKLPEFNFDKPGENDMVFLELEATRLNAQSESGPHDVIGYKLVILRGEPLEIVLTVDLHREVGQVNNTYIVLGKGTNKDVVVDLASAEVESVFSGSTLLPDLDDSIYAVLLVYSTFPSQLNELSLSREQGKFVPKPLDPMLRSLIREITVYMQVIGRKVHANYCSYFDTIRPLESIDSFRRVLLRDWDSPQEFDRDFSINNCCPLDEFYNSRCWYLGTPTPGAGNDCSRKQIILEEFILDLPNVRLPEISLVDEECAADYPGISSSSYNLISDHGYVRALGNSIIEFIEEI